MKEDNERQVILIMGSGHCGTTLLDMILSSHLQIFGVGELIQLPKIQDRLAPHSIWTMDLLDKIVPLFNDELILNRIIDKFIPGMRKNHLNIYSEIMDAAKSKIIVDSSKKLYWIKRSINQLFSSPVRPTLLYLKRSPYAVINSYWRKRKMNFNELIDWHKQELLAMDNYFNTLSISKMVLSYEELTNEPKRTVNAICNLINVDFSDEILDFWKQEPTQIGGNSGTKAFYDKYVHGKIDINERRKSFYQNHSMEIRPDERWKSELNDRQIDAISKAFEVHEN